MHTAFVVVDQRAIVSAVGQVKIAPSEHQYFSSDIVLLRATWRFGDAIVRPNRLGVFTVNGGGSSERDSHRRSQRRLVPRVRSRLA